MNDNILKTELEDTRTVKMNDDARKENRSAEIGDLVAALSKAQGAMQGAVKGSENPFFKSVYADLASVWEACRVPLSENGLAVIQIPGRSHGGTFVETIVAHSSGQWISCRIAATPKDAGPQALGSVITYLRRYGLASMVGISQVDDDGEAAMGRQSQSLSADQIDEIIALMDEKGLSKEDRQKWLSRLARRYGATHHSQIPEKAFDQAKAVISEALANAKDA